MLDGIRAQIDIQIWPVKVSWGWFFNIENFSYWRVLEPWKVIVGKKILRII